MHTTDIITKMNIIDTVPIFDNKNMRQSTLQQILDQLQIIHNI